LTRAIRRYYKQKKIGRIYQRYKRDNAFNDDSERLYMAKKVVDNPAVCSCEMCKNPRHAKYGTEKDKLTYQEKRENEIFGKRE